MDENYPLVASGQPGPGVRLFNPRDGKTGFVETPEAAKHRTATQSAVSIRWSEFWKTCSNTSGASSSVTTAALALYGA